MFLELCININFLKGERCFRIDTKGKLFLDWHFSEVDGDKIFALGELVELEVVIGVLVR
jgi:hypothetical protein